MGVVLDPELIGDGQEEGIGFGNRLVRSQLLDQRIRLGSVAAPKNGPRPFVDEADLIFTFAAASEIRAIAVVHECDDAAADRDPRLSCMAGLFPGRTVGPDLSGLLDVEGFSGLVVLECRAL